MVASGLPEVQDTTWVQSVWPGEEAAEGNGLQGLQVHQYPHS